MKKLLVFLCALSLILGMTMTASALPLQNLGFETGDFTGWTILDSVNDSTVSVVTTHTGPGTTTYLPPHGQYFAVIAAYTEGMTKQVYQLGFDLKLGDTVHGYAAFSPQQGDALPAPLTTARVTMADGSGAQLMWEARSDVQLVDGPWQSWSFTAVDDGLHSLDHTVERFSVAGMANQSSGSMMFDARFEPAPVPEPTTMLLFGAGLVGLAGFGRKKFKK